MSESKLTLGNYAGYALCDFANNLAFCVMGAYLSVYCSDILGINGWIISLIMIIARVWDAVNDPIMGFYAQSRKPGKNGKYRPFLLIGGYPLAVVSVLVFVKISDSVTVSTIWFAAAYILYGMIYTILLVPFGSLASVMTSKDNERSILSMCRAIGGGAGNLPTLLFPLFVMTAGKGGNQLDGRKLTIAMIIIAVAMIAFYSVSYRLTTETVIVDEQPQKTKVFSVFKELIKSKAFVTMSIIGCLLIATQMYTNTVNLYLFKDYFQRSGMNTVYMIVSYAPTVIMIPFANLIIKEIGKKEFSIVSLTVSVIASFLTFALHPGKEDIWLFIILALFINTGIGFLTLEIWSMAADIIDYQEWKTGARREAANYAFFTFMRKIGQAIAALAPWFVSLAGYDSKLAGAGVQSTEVLDSMYKVSTITPFIMFSIMLVMAVIYPLSKSESQKMHNELSAMHSKMKTETF